MMNNIKIFLLSLFIIFANHFFAQTDCQDYSIDIVNTAPGLSDTDSVWIDVCLGEQVTFTAEGTYPNNNQDYTQSDANTNWYWSISSSGAPYEENGVGMTDFTYTFNESGGYFVNLYAIDYNGCIVTWSGEIRIRVSIPPSFSNITQDQIVVCPNEEVNFTGDVTTNSWVMSITDEQVVQECITDDQGVSQEFCWNVSAFEPGQTITSGDDLESVCMNIEHSWVADVWIYIQCPNGQQAEINYYSTSNPCSGDEFGEPNQSDNCVPGVGYDYCWTMDATISHTDWCDDVGGNIPAGDYLPTGDFNSLVGCPINGEWCVVIIDDWGSDDGTLFSVSLNFNDAIAPASMWSYNHTYDPDDIVWTGDGIEPNSGGNATAYPTTPGDQVYAFTVIDDFGCEYDTTLTVHVRDYDDPDCCDFPTPDAGDDIDVCGPTYTFNATGSNGDYSNWSMISGPGNPTWQNQNSPNATVTVDIFGTYVFEFYEENQTPGCSSTDEIEVNFYPVPNTEFIYTPILCYGDTATITYTGNATDAANYTWGFQDAVVLSGSGQGPYEIKYPESGQFEITLHVEENGCNSNDTVVNIISPAELSGDLIVEDDPCFESCNGRAVIDVQGGTAPYTYSWASNSPVYSNVCAGNYSLTVTDQNACSFVRNFTINQPPELVVTATNSTDATCFGYSDGSMSITAQGGTGELTYTWSQPIGEAGPIITDIIAGNYFVTVSDENACFVVEAFQVAQPDEMIINVSPDIAICQHDETVLVTDFSGGTAPYAYMWDRGEGAIIGPVDLPVSPDETTTYSVYVEDINGCTSNIDEVTVTVSPEMIIDSMIINNNRCYHTCDGSAEIDMTGGIGPFDYSWGADTYLFEGLCAGLYQVTVTDVIGCSVGTTFVITEPDSITYTYQMEPATCYGYDDGEISIFVEGGTQPYSYLWPNGETTNTMINEAGTYQVTVTDANNCRIEPNLSIAQPSEIIVQTGGNSEICISQEAGLYAQATGGVMPYDFVWSDNFGYQYLTNHVIVTPDTTTYYTLTVTDAQGCIGNIETITVNVLPPLKINSVTTSFDTVCPREPATIYVDATGGYGGPYILMLQDGRVVPSPFNVYPEETTMYYITLMDVCGTPAVTDSIEINVYPDAPNVFIADLISGCAPLTINFEEISPNQGQTYLWNFGDNGFDIVKNPSHTYIDPGVYTVELTTRNSFGCLNTRSIYEMITVHPKPIADFITEPESVSILDAEIEFINTSELAQDAYWVFGDGDSSNNWSPIHKYPNIGTYEITLIVENMYSCKDTASHTINVNGEFSFYAPTAFTPNGDGKNDCFRVCGNGIDPNEFFMVVYDRWGNKVYETDIFEPNVDCKACTEGAWDGSNQGSVNKGDEVLENGVYSWFCEFKDWNGIIFNKQGTVNLIR